jgi:small subunit ribosomal protein S6
MRVYEELFIIKPDTPEEEVDGFVEQIKQVITSGKGTVDKVDNWGIRKLAYRVSKYNEGRYVLVVFSSTPELVHEVERRMRVADLVIKFITVRIDEKIKKIEKRKKSRDKRAARRPPPQMPVPAAASIPSAPGEHASGPGLPSSPSPAKPEPARPEPAKAEPVTPELVTQGPVSGEKE